MDAGVIQIFTAAQVDMHQIGALGANLFDAEVVDPAIPVELQAFERRAMKRHRHEGLVLDLAATVEVQFFQLLECVSENLRREPLFKMLVSDLRELTIEAVN
jgi:hypothetical protein